MTGPTGPAGPAPSSSTEGRGANAALEDWEHPPRSWQDLYARTETLLIFLARLAPIFGPIGFLFKDIHHTGVTTAILGPTHFCSTGECHKYAHFTGRGLRHREQQQFTQGLGQKRDFNPCESRRRYPSSKFYIFPFPPQKVSADPALLNRAVTAHQR